MDEHIFAARILLDEAEALVRVEKFDCSLALANDLGRHAAAITAAAAGSTRSAASAAAEATAAARWAAITAAKTATAWCAEAITAAATKTVATTTTEWIETVLAETVPLVPALAATSSIETHKSERTFASSKC